MKREHSGEISWPTTKTRTAQVWRRDRPRAEAAERLVPDETPIGLAYDGQPHAVLMGTPADIEDLAAGFTVTEGVADFSQIVGIEVEAHIEGLSVDIRLKPGTDRAGALARKRTLEGRSSCGLCGIESLASAVRPLDQVRDGPRITRVAIQRALAELEARQEMGRLTRAMHAAAWADVSGAVGLVREDVGRHNALDKLIGAALTAGVDPARAFIVITSRCSYEMVEKAAKAGVGVLVAISAPTALAIRKAEEAGLTLVALARADGHAVFTHPERIADAAPAEARA